MSSLTDEIREDIAAGGALAKATAQGLEEENALRAEIHAGLCRCGNARGAGCFNDRAPGAELCADCIDRGCGVGATR